MMNYEPFYEKCQRLPDKEKQWVDVFYKNLLVVFDSDSPRYDDVSAICKLFYGGGKGLSKAQYYRKRNLVRLFYDWLLTQELVSRSTVDYVYTLEMKDVVSNEELTHYYFKNLDAALDFVTLVGRAKGCGAEDDLLNIKSILILAWYGVELYQMVTIKKSDLIDACETVVVHNETGNFKIKLTTEYYKTLRRFSELDLHKGFPSQKGQMYLSSSFLMRSAKQECMSPNNIFCALRRFNDVADDYGKCLNLTALRKNGIFCVVFEQEREGKTVGVLIKDLINCDRSFAFGYKEFYETWKKLFIEGGGDN